MANLFQNLQIEAFRAGITPRTEQSREWFRKKAQQLTRVNRERLMKQDPIEQVGQMRPGDMYMYFYDPKHKDTLPYYDKFPLVVAVEPAKDGFYGLNLHYLPPILRAKLLDSLMDNTTNKSYDESTRFKISYQILKRASTTKHFKPCFKHYLFKHVKSRFAKVQAPEWEIATFLPTAQWEKSSAASVYRDSRRMI